MYTLKSYKPSRFLCTSSKADGQLHFFPMTTAEAMCIVHDIQFGESYFLFCFCDLAVQYLFCQLKKTSHFSMCADYTPQ